MRLKQPRPYGIVGWQEWAVSPKVLPLSPLAFCCPIRQSEGRSVPAMPRPRYRQDPLPIGPDAPQVELFGPEQPNPPGLELMQQGHLEVVPLGPLFEKDRQEGDESGATELG